MATPSSLHHSDSPTTETASFVRFAGVCALITGLGGLLYALSFLVVRSTLLSSLFLMSGGFFSLAVLTALYQRFAQTHASFARWTFLLSGAGALGTLIHGGYDLANTLHPLAIATEQASLPNAIDPRGLLAFGLSGLGLFFIAWLIGQDHHFPRALSYWGYVTAVLLLGLYLGRLIILDPTSPLIAFPALISGFILNPIWYLWLGVALLRK